MNVTMSTMQSLICLTCRVTFKDSQIHRTHYSSEWHRYNLHRKVANLPPITLDAFEKKNEIYSQETANQTKKIQNCKICRKKFHNERQYENHLASKSHMKQVEKKDNAAFNEDSASIEDEKMIETDSDVESVDSNKWLEDLDNPVEHNGCLFCNHHSRSITRNLKHMVEKHSFFVPDLDYCIDQKGLLIYLGQKIYGEYKCIWCNDSGKKLRSAEAVRMHMIDKGHCKMLYEGEALLEYLQFYDYSSSYPDAEDNDPDAELPEISPVLLDNDCYELQLPSGKVVGHRALAIYYKQNLNLGLVAVAKSHKLHKLIHQYRALGGPETQVEATRRRIRDIRYLQRVQTKYSTQLQFKQNKLQKHFRQQINF